MAVVARSGLLLDETNFLHHTNHKTGQHPKTDDIGKTMIETLLKDHQKSSSRQKRGLCDDSNPAFATDDIKEAYNDCYNDASKVEQNQDRQDSNF